MARKLLVLVKAAFCLLSLLVIWNVFWATKLPPSLETRISDPILTTLHTISKDLKPDSIPSAKNSDSQGLCEQYVIHIAVVVCGNRSNETITMIKSAMIFSDCHIKFIIFSDSKASEQIKSAVNHWPKTVTDRLELDIQPIMFPPDHAEEWRKLFKPCASQRLFLPSILDGIDSLLYVDTDTLFLTSPTRVWHHFENMNQLQIAAVAPEHEDHSTGWYNRFARHPYYGTLGINSGVMLMNLTRMRAFGWEKYVVPIYQEYKSKITWGDQDIINIVFHYHPEKLYIYPCNHNYRPDHCMYMSVCKSAEDDGIIVLHGNRGTFHNEKQPAFKAVYSAIEQHDFSDDLFSLLRNMKLGLHKTSHTNCGKLPGSFIKAAEQHIKKLSAI